MKESGMLSNIWSKYRLQKAEVSHIMVHLKTKDKFEIWNKSNNTDNKVVGLIISSRSELKRRKKNFPWPFNITLMLFLLILISGLSWNRHYSPRSGKSDGNFSLSVHFHRVGPPDIPGGAAGQVRFLNTFFVGHLTFYIQQAASLVLNLAVSESNVWIAYNDEHFLSNVLTSVSWCGHLLCKSDDFSLAIITLAEFIIQTDE